MDEVVIVGGGVGGLTLGLARHAAGIPCRIFESVAEIRPVGVGINLLPHASKELAALGLEETLSQPAIETKDATFFNRSGNLSMKWSAAEIFFTAAAAAFCAALAAFSLSRLAGIGGNGDGATVSPATLEAALRPSTTAGV